MAKRKTLPAPPEEFAAGWLGKLDSRYGLTQEMRQRYAALTDDLGGADTLSYAARSLCERALWLEYWLSMQERELVGGADGAFDVGKWTQAVNSLQGLYSKLGLRRVPRDVPTLRSIIARHGANGSAQP